MIRAKVELFSIAARTGAKWGIGFYTTKCKIKGPIAIGTKIVARKSNTLTLIDGVSLMAGKFSFQHCFTLILPKYDESLVFVNIIENFLRGPFLFQHLHILTQSSFQEGNWLKQEPNCSHQERQQVMLIDEGVSLPHFILFQYWRITPTWFRQSERFSHEGASVLLGWEQCPSALDTLIT